MWILAPERILDPGKPAGASRTLRPAVIGGPWRREGVTPVTPITPGRGVTPVTPGRGGGERP
jgi:hypothetical protein